MLDNKYILDTTEDDENSDEPEDHIEKTAFRFPLMSEDWVRGLDNQIDLGSYRHKIILIKYIILFILITLIGGYVSYTVESYVILAVSIILSLLVLGYGLFKYWSVYYVVTRERIIPIEGLYTGSTVNKVKHDDIVETTVERGVFGRTMNVLLGWGYGDIIFRTASDSKNDEGRREQVLYKVRNPYHFQEAINEISDEKSNK